MESVKRVFQEIKKKGRVFGSGSSSSQETDIKDLYTLATLVEEIKHQHVLLDRPNKEIDKLLTHIRGHEELLRKGKKLDPWKFNSVIYRELALDVSAAPLDIEKLKREGQLLRYEVFLSFRGEDTRASFISHLYASLQNNGITVFKDDESLQRGDHISTSLMQSIKESRISVIVFSKNYADSQWCLEELMKIMECYRNIRQIVLPLFYDVDPSDVRHQTGEFGKAFQSLLTKTLEKDASRKWRDTLRDATALAGIVLVNSRDENKAIKEIAEKIVHLLDKKDLFIAEKPVGVDSRVEDAIQLLDIQQSNDVLLLGMWGMGGIGKTTIAKAIYNTIGRNFEGRSFVSNVREVWQQPAGKVSLQEQLLSNIFKGTTTKIESIDDGKIKLKDRLSHHRVLIVLDDVDELEQLDALCGNRNWFGKGSRIIITTRNKHIVGRNVVDKIFSNKELDERESTELFEWHAFKQVSPTEEFVAISKNVIMYSGGLPLALEVLGRYLFDRDVKDWEDVLEKLKRIPNDKVHKKLQISYDGLEDDFHKAIFLDIACFFIGMDKNEVIHILNGCGFYAENGINVLVERSLVTIDDENKLRMHDLLRDMGREIICDKPRKEPEERSRLWFHEDVHNVLAGKTGTKAIEGLALKLPRDGAKCYNTKAFTKMKKLRLLQFVGVQLDGDFEYLSKNLRWLSWKGFPLSCIPANFYQGNLVSIELENSNVKVVWKETQRMEKLKILNLSHSHYLTQTPDFSNMPNLEKLVLTDCPMLSKVSHSIGHLSKVLLINLEDCVSLCSLPRSIYKLKSVKTFILAGCKKIKKLEEDLEQMGSLTTLLANNTAITRMPLSILRSKSIGYISLRDYEGLSHDVFPSIIWSWMPPTSALSSLFQTSVAMSFIVSLDIHIPDGSSQELSSIFNNLSWLRSLWVKFGCELQLSEDAKIILDAFYASLSKELESTSDTSQASNMKTSALTQSCSHLHVSESKPSMKSVLIQMGMNCQATNNLKENISQNMNDWLTFNCEGSSVSFEVPQVEGRMLKAIVICIAYSSTPDDIASDCLTNLLVKNYTKATIQLYKREAVSSLGDEEGQRVVSSIEPGNKVEVVVVFENSFIVKKTTIYLIYDEPVAEKVEDSHGIDKKVILSSVEENKCFVGKVSSHAQDKSVIYSSGGENECCVREVSPHAQDKNEPIVEKLEEFLDAQVKNEPTVDIVEFLDAQDKNGEDKEGFVRKVSPQVPLMDDLKQKRRNILMRIWQTVKEWLGKHRCC
ncbi:disease resistance protein RPV1-like isoform X1 [Trifolium pratense]|nr:disease resistance protein RPV1-like isoform X1 [Trifolium pratense]